MKRVFGFIEVFFDILYLITAFIIGFFLLFTRSTSSTQLLAAWMSLILAFGDSFHLIPRILLIFSGKDELYRIPLGYGKMITSITMTIFYLLLWNLLQTQVLNTTNNFTSNLFIFNLPVYVLAGIRIILCFFPQNKWTNRYPPVTWGILRNIPFFLLGLICAGVAFFLRQNLDSLKMIYLAILFSFGFYIPVVLFSNTHPKIGILMLPKTISYVWILIMCLYLK